MTYDKIQLSLLKFSQFVIVSSQGRCLREVCLPPLTSHQILMNDLNQMSFHWQVSVRQILTSNSENTAVPVLVETSC